MVFFPFSFFLTLHYNWNKLTGEWYHSWVPRCLEWRYDFLSWKSHLRLLLPLKILTGNSEIPISNGKKHKVASV